MHKENIMMETADINYGRSYVHNIHLHIYRTSIALYSSICLVLCMSADGGREGGMPHLFIRSWHTSYESNLFLQEGVKEEETV